MEQFSNWIPLTEGDVEKSAPLKPAALQVKAAGELIDYPIGKSAMVWYGYAANNAARVLREQFDDELRKPGVRGHGPLQFRFIAGGDAARETLETVFRKFARNFGRPPLYNADS